MSALRIGLVPALALALSFGISAAYAQTAAPPAPAATTAPAAKPMKPMAKPKVHKVSVTKACTTAGHKQKLKGDAFKKFEADCVRHGGPSA
jgi:hypothetical protein